MREGRAWQELLLHELSEALRAEVGVRALVLTGSLADSTVSPDEWSDIDLTAIVADRAAADVLSRSGCLARHGEVIGLERHDDPGSTTLRVCFAPCRRVDISLVPEAVLKSAARGESSRPTRAHLLLWSKLSDLEGQIQEQFPAPPFRGHSAEGIATLVEAFWFKAATAIAKTARNDLLVGLHLALDLCRDCLVLRMIDRDQAEGTNIHRMGRSGDEAATELLPTDAATTANGILDLVRRSTLTFDNLALQVLPGYLRRAGALAPALCRAEAVCGLRQSPSPDRERLADPTSERG
jgi:predicted nucleotidyltransferase